MPLQHHRVSQPAGGAGGNQGEVASAVRVGDEPVGGVAQKSGMFEICFFSFIRIHVYSLPDSRGSEWVPQCERPSPSVEIFQGEGAKGGLGSATEN